MSAWLNRPVLTVGLDALSERVDTRMDREFSGHYENGIRLLQRLPKDVM